ncbi:MAG: hypothetical protein GY870_16945 [archaeon]|nr:hypothetical protein [archaeon]
MHKIKCECLNVVAEKTRGEKQTEYNVLQVEKKGEFIHEITGTIRSAQKVTSNGLEVTGVRLLTNGGKYVRFDKLIDTDIEKKYQVGKEVTVLAYPEIKNNNGKPDVFFHVVDEDSQVFKDSEPYITSIKDWQNRKWSTDKEITLAVKFSPYLSQQYNGMNYTVLDD